MAITRIYYNKLVRDNIKHRIEQKGANCDVRLLTDVQEFQQELFKKIAEEANTLSMARTKEEFIGEYCDLMVALEALIEQLEISPEELQKAKDESMQFKGAYKHRHFLHWSDDLEYKSDDSPQGIPI